MTPSVIGLSASVKALALYWMQSIVRFSLPVFFSKMNRLETLTNPDVEQKVEGEKIEDTLMDLAAYAIMAIESLRNS